MATNALYGSIVYVGQDTGLSTRRGRIITGWSHHGSLRLEMISEVSLDALPVVREVLSQKLSWVQVPTGLVWLGRVR